MMCDFMMKFQAPDKPDPIELIWALKQPACLTGQALTPPLSQMKC